MMNRVHEFIVDYNSSAAIKEIKSVSTLGLPAQQLNSINNSGLTALQQATRNGMLEVVLELLLAGIEINGRGFTTTESVKSPLYIAIEQGHYFIADVLLALGADKIIVIQQANSESNEDVKEFFKDYDYDKNILMGVCVWAVKKNSLINLKKAAQVFQQESGVAKIYLSALIELSEQLRYTTLTRFLLTFTKPRQHKSIRTAAYWRIKNNFSDNIVFNEHDYAELLPDSKAWVVTLHQLYQDSSLLFNFCFKDLTEDIRSTFLRDKSQAKETVDFIYEAAAKCDLEFLLDSCKEQEDYEKSLMKALQDKNYVALKTLLMLDGFVPQLPPLLKEKRFKLLTLLLINYHPNLYEVTLGYFNNDQLFNFLEEYWSVEGFRRSLIGRGVGQKGVIKPSLMNLVDRLQEFNLRDFVDDLIYFIKRDLDIELKQIEHVQSSTRYEVIVHDALEANLFTKVRIRFNRFKLSIRHARFGANPSQTVFERIPTALWQHILEFLGTNDHHVLPILCLSFNNFMLSARPMDIVALTEEKIRQLEVSVGNQKFFLDLVLADCEKDRRDKICIWALISFVFFCGFGVMIYFTDKTFKDSDDIKNHYYNDPINNTTCDAYNNRLRDLISSCIYNQTNVLEFCKNLCDDYFTAQAKEMGFVAGDALSGLLGIMAFIAIIIIYTAQYEKLAFKKLSKNSIKLLNEKKFRLDNYTPDSMIYIGPMAETINKDKLSISNLEINQLQQKSVELKIDFIDDYFFLDLPQPKPAELKIEILDDEKVEEENDEQDSPLHQPVSARKSTFPFWKSNSYARLPTSLDEEDKKEEITVEAEEEHHPLLIGAQIKLT